MGYDLHITRRKLWLDKENDIALEEFVRHISNDTEFRYPDENDDDYVDCSFPARLCFVGIEASDFWWMNTSSNNEGAPANRHPPVGSAEHRDRLFTGLACNPQRRVPVAGRSAASTSRLDALRLGVFAPL